MKTRILPILSAVLAAALPLGAAAADGTSAPAARNAAQGRALTVYGGYRFGGGFADADTARSMDLKSSGAFAASLDFPLDQSRQYQLFVAYQDTKLQNATASGGDLPMSIAYLHLGGTSFVEGPVGKGLYVVGGLGATWFSPSASGTSSEVRPSMNVGVGYQWPLGRDLSMRLEARGYVTLINSDSALFCSGGCVYRIQGDVFTQGEALIGVSARF